MWVGSDATARDATWLLNGVLLDTTLRSVVMKGYVGLTPSRTHNESAQMYEGYVARLRAVAATTGSGAQCNLATDDDSANPSYIWAQDHDSDSSTPLACGGDDNQIVRASAHPAHIVAANQSYPHSGATASGLW
jgi:hypothetical protein